MNEKKSLILDKLIGKLIPNFWCLGLDFGTVYEEG